MLKTKMKEISESKDKETDEKISKLKNEFKNEMQINVNQSYQKGKNLNPPNKTCYQKKPYQCVCKKNY